MVFYSAWYSIKKSSCGLSTLKDYLVGKQDKLLIKVDAACRYLRTVVNTSFWIEQTS
jgi:hypothetical protein